VPGGGEGHGMTRPIHRLDQVAGKGLVDASVFVGGEDGFHVSEDTTSLSIAHDETRGGQPRFARLSWMSNQVLR
jgi:hypothetical protein